MTNLKSSCIQWSIMPMIYITSTATSVVQSSWSHFAMYLLVPSLNKCWISVLWLMSRRNFTQLCSTLMLGFMWKGWRNSFQIWMLLCHFFFLAHIDILFYFWWNISGELFLLLYDNFQLRVHLSSSSCETKSLPLGKKSL